MNRGYTIFQFRVTRDLTQAELAKLAELPIEELDAIEVGDKDPSDETFYHLCDALHVDYLIAQLYSMRGSDARNKSKQRKFCKFMEPLRELMEYQVLEHIQKKPEVITSMLSSPKLEDFK